MAKNRRYADMNVTRNILVPSGTVSGDPVMSGFIAGVAVINRGTDLKATVQLDGVYDLSVKGVTNSAANVAVAEGDLLYYSAGHTPKIDKDTTGTLFGKALGAVVSGATTTIPVQIGNR